MLFEVEIRGISPLLMHNGAAGLDTRSPANIEKAEIAKKRGSNRTALDDARLAELEVQTGLYIDESGAPTLPAAAIRSCTEFAARKLRQGPMVREGLIVDSIIEFKYDKNLGTTVDELGKSTQFTVPVVVQRSRILRTRPKFDEWGLVFRYEVDPELIDQSHLESWLDIAGRRLGLGDWRPQKSGHFGRFETIRIEEVQG